VSEFAAVGTAFGRIRNIVLVTLKPGVTQAEVDDFEAALGGLRIEGMVSLTVCADLELRDGNADLAIIADFADEASYERYDLDPHHQQIRQTIATHIMQRAVRIQVAIDQACS